MEENIELYKTAGLDICLDIPSPETPSNYRWAL